MRNPLARIPWYMATPAFLGAVVVAAFAANYLGADYFERTRLDEADPLAVVEPAPSNSDVPATAPGSGMTPAALEVMPTPTRGAPAAGPVILSQGNFRDGEPGHRGSGTAKLGRDSAGKPVLVLENFSVTNGPDLHVILGASANGGSDGLDLGKLKATDGTFSYSIPEGTDLTGFRSVTIWCASFPTIFAVATLGA